MELMAMDSDGANVRQLTADEVVNIYAHDPEITADGTRIVYNSDIDLVRVQADGSDLFPIVHGHTYYQNIAADGETIVFQSYSDLTGGSCSAYDVFRIQADGTGLVQLTIPDNCDTGSSHPRIADDGSTVVFQSWGTYGGVYPDGTPLWSIPASAR